MVTAERHSLASDGPLTIRIERRGLRRYPCSGCGGRVSRVRSVRDRTWDDRPWAAHPVTLIYAQRRPMSALRHSDGADRVRRAEGPVDARRAATDWPRLSIDADQSCGRAPPRELEQGAPRPARVLAEGDRGRPTHRPRYLGADEIHRGQGQPFWTVWLDLVRGEVIGLELS